MKRGRELVKLARCEICSRAMAPGGNICPDCVKEVLCGDTVCEECGSVVLGGSVCYRCAKAKWEDKHGSLGDDDVFF
jgi:predicted amidophosphoribosyltransferase